MKISLIHPSRGRAYKAQETVNEWFSLAEDSIYHPDMEHIVSIDYEDDNGRFYNELFADRSKIVCGHNTNVVEATNRAAKEATGDILVYLSDDFKCPKNWNTYIIAKFLLIPHGQPALLKVDDCLQKFSRQTVTLPVMNRALYLKLGYFFNPLYKSMWADDDLFAVCKKNGWLMEAPELKFKHEHHSQGITPMDDTYRRSEAHFEEGKQLFNQRKKEGFTI